MITELTEEQKKDLEAYYKEWLAIGLSTDPIDEVITKEVLTDFYRRLGKVEPRFLTFASPRACCMEGPKAVGNTDPKASEEVYKAYYAQGWWSYWVAFYRFAERIGCKYTPEQSQLLLQWDRLTRSCHWF